MSLPKSLRKRFARLRVAFGKGESSACRDLYGVPSYSQNAFSEVARGTAGTAAVARLGACYHEPGMRARAARRSGKSEAICLAMNSVDTSRADLMKREPHPDEKPMGAFSHRSQVSMVAAAMLAAKIREHSDRYCLSYAALSLDFLPCSSAPFAGYHARLAIGGYHNTAYGSRLTILLNRERPTCAIHLRVRSHIGLWITGDGIVFSVKFTGPTRYALAYRPVGPRKDTPFVLSPLGPHRQRS